MLFHLSLTIMIIVSVLKFLDESIFSRKVSRRKSHRLETSMILFNDTFSFFGKFMWIFSLLFKWNIVFVTILASGLGSILSSPWTNSKFWTANPTWNSIVCWKFNFFESVPYKTNIIWTLFDLISFWGGFPRFLQFRKQKTACLTNLFSGCTCCVETGHLICGTYRLTGFFTVGMTTNRVFRAGYTISFFVSLALSLLDFLRLYFLHL